MHLAGRDRQIFLTPSDAGGHTRGDRRCRRHRVDGNLHLLGMCREILAVLMSGAERHPQGTSSSESRRAGCVGRGPTLWSWRRAATRVERDREPRESTGPEVLVAGAGNRLLACDRIGPDGARDDCRAIWRRRRAVRYRVARRWRCSTICAARTSGRRSMPASGAATPGEVFVSEPDLEASMTRRHEHPPDRAGRSLVVAHHLGRRRCRNGCCWCSWRPAQSDRGRRDGRI